MRSIITRALGNATRLLVAVAALLLVSPASAADNAVVAVYQPYQVLLDRFLIEKDLPGDGLASAFDYRAAMDHPETESLLDRQDAKLANFDPGGLDTREQAVSFYLDAYNYFMIAYILRHPENGEPVGSVRDYGSWIQPYRVFNRKLFDIGGRKHSLSEIEKEILLGDEFREKGWWDARVHFAVNCASVGCPPLRDVMYTPDNVDALLTENTRRAFNTERHLRLEGDTLYVSELFGWYEDDFLNEEGSVESFIKRYADEQVIGKVENANRIHFIDYDWTLNSPVNFPEISD